MTSQYTSRNFSLLILFRRHPLGVGYKGTIAFVFKDRGNILVFPCRDYGPNDGVLHCGDNRDTYTTESMGLKIKEICWKSI